MTTRDVEPTEEHREARRVLQGDLWDTINRDVRSCKGDPSKHVYGNVERQKAAATIEGIVRRFEEAAESHGERRGLERAAELADEAALGSKLHADERSLLSALAVRIRALVKP